MPKDQESPTCSHKKKSRKAAEQNPWSSHGVKPGNLGRLAPLYICCSWRRGAQATHTPTSLQAQPQVVTSHWHTGQFWPFVTLIRNLGQVTRLLTQLWPTCKDRAFYVFLSEYRACQVGVGGSRCLSVCDRPYRRFIGPRSH